MIYLNKYIHLHQFCTDPFSPHEDNEYIKGEFMFDDLPEALGISPKLSKKVFESIANACREIFAL